MQYSTTINDDSVYGITAARNAYNSSLPQTVKEGEADVPNPAILPHDSAYLDFVLGSAVQSWCKQYAPTVVPVVPTTNVSGVPQVISKRQGRAQLKADGLLTTVEGYVASLPADDNTRMAYEDAAEWVRTDHNIVGMLAMLGKSPENADTFFTSAALL